MGFAATFAITSVVGIAESRRQQRKIEKAQGEAQKIDIARQNEEALRARRKTIREARIRQAQIENIAGATGQTQDSAVIGSTNQISGQAKTNLADIESSLAISRASTEAQGAIFRAQQPSGLQQVAAVGQQAAIAFKS